MLVPLSWLKDYLDIRLTDEQLADTLTLAGLEVDKIEKTSTGFTNIVVCQVIKTFPHPEADRLKIAEVSDGSENYQVVCGAPNCREGLITAFAKIGATLTDKSGKEFKIKKSKLRGIESYGMLCSKDELGLSPQSEGIMELDPQLPLGAKLEELYGETVFEISLTPNLGHCSSIRGIARELAALLNLQIKKQTFSIQESPHLHIGDRLKVSVENYDHCLRYSAMYIENIEVKPSPEWLKKRLELSGIRSINNIVDITNYVMVELGQPMHAFDYDTIEGAQINIKLSEAPQSFISLDDQERKIPQNTLLICDENKTLAIAGVIGGASSAVSNSTTRLILEAAHFHPSMIRKTSKSLNLRTDSSSRFEKNTDPNATIEALKLASYLITQIAGGDIASEIIDEKSKLFTKKRLSLRLEKLNNLLGTSLSLGDITNILSGLELAPSIDETEKLVHVEVPTYRNDIHFEIDLIEEVARIYGYNNIPYSPGFCHVSPLSHSPLYLAEKTIRKHLISSGLQECVTCNLISPKLAHLGFHYSYTKNPLAEVLHPSSVDQSILRPSLLPGLLHMIKHNFDRQTFSISAFEIGQIHFRRNEEFQEKTSVGIILTGASSPLFWGEKQKDYDFYDLKGILETLFGNLEFKDIQFNELNLEGFHPGRKASIQTTHAFLGVIGEVHPRLLDKLDIHQKVYFAELDLHELFKLKKQKIQMKPLPQFPGSERDWTQTFNVNTAVGKVLQTFQSISSRLLKEVNLIDIYTSENIGSDKKNLTFRFYYCDDKKTIDYDSVEREHHRILSLFKTQFTE